eukprot:scaffold537_cov241-Pinguiococcus_pyrenoidosus.AAC.6
MGRLFLAARRVGGRVVSAPAPGSPLLGATDASLGTWHRSKRSSSSTVARAAPCFAVPGDC